MWADSVGRQGGKYAIITIDVECRRDDPAELQRRAIFGDLGGREYGLNRIYECLAHHAARGVFFVDFSMFYFAEPLLAETLASVVASGHDVALHLHWNQLPRHLKPQREHVVHEAVEYFARVTGERPLAYRGGSYLIDDAIAAALLKENVILEFSFFLQKAENCSFYKRDLGNAFTWYEGLYAVPVTAMPKKRVHKLDVNRRSLEELLLGVEKAAVPVLFLHSMSFMTPWDGDGRLSGVDETSQQLFEAVLAHWHHNGVRTLGLKEIRDRADELIELTTAAEERR